jgi:hypothetical protein
MKGPSMEFRIVETPKGPMVRITDRATGALIDHVDLDLFDYMVRRAEAEVELEPRTDRWTNEPS